MIVPVCILCFVALFMWSVAAIVFGMDDCEYDRIKQTNGGWLIRSNPAYHIGVWLGRGREPG